MSIAAILIKVASVVTQLWLARLLAQDDFGLYAAAIGVAGFVTAFRDGGVTMYLIKHGRRHYAELAAPVFWFALVINLIGAGVLLLIGGGLLVFGPQAAASMEAPSRSTFLDPELPSLLAIIALSMPLGTPAAILSAKLRLDLRFVNLSLMRLLSSLFRYAGSVWLALNGFGAMSFVLPILAVAVLEYIWGQLATRDVCWIGWPECRLWLRIIDGAKWLIFGTFGQITYNMGAYFLIAFFLAKPVVGVYFFAYQMIQQIAALMNANLQHALAPSLVHLDDQPERLRAAARRTLHVLMLLSAPLMIGVTVTIAPFETLVLGGEWTEAVLPIQIFGALSPLAMTWGVTYSILTSQGRFRIWAIASVLEGTGVTLAAGLGAWLTGSAVGATVATAMAIIISRLAITVVSMRTLDLPGGETFRAIAPAWALGIVCMGPALLLDRSLGDAHALTRFVLSGAMFSLLYAIGARALLGEHVRDLLSVAPGRLSAIAHQLALLPPR